ncbi:MAG: NADH-quinone oxidoreductase subunit NuoF [Actinobacteria bacterium]|nr:NADH-quinone oxidoreductase subunit NuoF [Actinomycetota bacterium]
MEKPQPLTANIHPGLEPPDINAYEKLGGYRALRQAIGSMAPEEVTRAVKDSHLKGRGGAGFDTGQKWSFVPMGNDAVHPKYLVVNADEMEPGTFKDRLLLEGGPHQLIEGAILAAYAVQADIAYIFLRWAYRLAARRLTRAIAEAYDHHYLGRNIRGSGYSLELYLHVSGGRYICGEETGLLNAIEGKRANPRSKPPFPQTSGLWGKPTVVNNVETLCNLPHIVNNGAEWFQGLSLSGEGGTKIYGASGRVRRPGAWELPMGTTIRELLEDHAGGMKAGYGLRGVLPGGASTDFLVEEHLDVKMDFSSVQKAGSRLGTGTMIIMDDHTCPVGMVLNLQRFFAQESCGWCSPCWGGLQWVAQTLAAIEAGEGQPEDLEMLKSHVAMLSPGHTYCALAPGAMEPLGSALTYFSDDFERHIREKRCAWRKQW